MPVEQAQNSLPNMDVDSATFFWGWDISPHSKFFDPSLVSSQGTYFHNLPQAGGGRKAVSGVTP
jgi:hypothetical protein